MCVNMTFSKHMYVENFVSNLTSPKASFHEIDQLLSLCRISLGRGPKSLNIRWRSKTSSHTVPDRLQLRVKEPTGEEEKMYP